MRVKDVVQVYPVLRENKNSYADGNFKMNLKEVSPVSNGGAAGLKLTVQLELNQPSIKEEIDNGNATLAVHLECPVSFYRELFQITEPEFSVVIPANQIQTSLEVSGFVLSTKKISSFAPMGLKPIAQGLNFDVPKAAFLATAPTQIIDLEREPNPIKRVDSAICIVRGDKDQQGMTLDLEEDRIQIVMNPEEYYNYNRVKASPDKLQSIRMGIVLPALVATVSRMAENEEIRSLYSDRAWYQALGMQSKDVGMGDISDWSVTDAFVIAQALIGNPVKEFLQEALTELEEE